MRKKVAFQFFVSNFALAVNFGLTIVLARLLTPEDIGIFSMSAVLVGIAHVFRDFGVSSFIKQEREVTSSILSGAIGLLLASSLGMAVILYLSSGLWAQFFDEPRVATVIQVLSIGFAFIPLGAIPQALLMRDMNVRSTAFVTVFSTVVYFIASVAFALNDFGYMTMAWANLVNIIVSGIAYNFVLERNIKWKPSIQHWTLIARFGSGNLIASMLKTVDASIPGIMLGKWSTAANVGLYSRANSTVNMVTKLINPTIYFFAVPFLAKKHHSQGDICQAFLRGDSIISCLLIPPLIGIAILAEPIVLFLYGPQWIFAVPAIPWLCLAAGIKTMFSLTAYAVTGKGKPQAVIPALLITVICKITAVAWLFDGTLISFAKAILIGQLAGAPAFMWVNWRHLGIPATRWAINIARPLPVWIVITLVTWMTYAIVPKEIGSFFALLIVAIPLAVATLAGYTLSKLAISEEIQFLYRRIL